MRSTKQTAMLTQTCTTEGTNYTDSKVWNIIKTHSVIWKQKPNQCYRTLQYSMNVNRNI